MRFIVGLCVAGFVLAGCNTVSGAGQDIENAGEAVQAEAAAAAN
ncbi:entericidin A/B family lipoprotein [Meridianimarinicoccus roseus]|nr:entericidin A/B family lipoprotein [Meridianimarinicoccus roseus]